MKTLRSRSAILQACDLVNGIHATKNKQQQSKNLGCTGFLNLARLHINIVVITAILTIITIIIIIIIIAIIITFSLVRPSWESWTGAI
jgi:hypothetical protein